MIDMNQVNDFCQKIVQQFDPQKILLFGSYAYGMPDPDSDIDLLVRTPKQIEERISKNDFFIKEIFEKGKILYEAPDSSMDR